MAAPTLESLIEKEFQEVQKTREDLLAKRAEIDEQLKALDLRLTAAVNYKATLEGKFTSPSRERKARAPSTGRAPRGSREQLKQQILDLIRKFPGGLTAEGINSELQTTDAKEKQRIANVLSLMKKEGALSQPAKRGPYTIAPVKREPEE
jgi:hypothetical protein